MTYKITTRDIEAISAYLDDELKPRERARLEARLQAEPRLRAALDELEQTRTLLRSVPQVRAPRNFTLAPEAAPRRSFSFQIFPTLQFASALAAILLVLIVAGDAFGVLSPRPVFTTARGLATQEVFFEEVVEAATGEALPAEAPMAAELAEEKPEGEPLDEGDVGVGGESEEMGEPQIAAESGVEDQSMMAVETEQIPAAPFETPPYEKLEISTPSYSLEATESVQTPAPEGLETQKAAYPPPETPVPIEPVVDEGIPVPALRLIEILLAVIVIVTGAGAFALRRRMFG